MVGTDWVWPIATTLVLLGAIAMVRLLLASAVRPGNTANRAEPLEDARHRSEEGDLTRGEFGRLRRKKAA